MLWHLAFHYDWFAQRNLQKSVCDKQHHNLQWQDNNAAKTYYLVSLNFKELIFFLK